MMKKLLNRLFLAASSLPLLIGDGLAAREISINTFTESGSDFWSGVEPVKPMILKLLGAIIVLYGVSLVAGTFGSGIKTNIAPLVNSLEMRSQGYKGIAHVAGGIFLVVIVLAICFSLWNDMFSGKGV